MNTTADSRLHPLIAAALEAQQRAYAPYSHFQVGAAILDGSGRIFTGANVENASYGLTLCAERVAASAAVTAIDAAPKTGAAPKHNWQSIAVASRGGVTPCGACRQFLMEFAPDMEVWLVDSTTSNVARLAALRQLLPAAFEFSTPFRQGP